MKSDGVENVSSRLFERKGRVGSTACTSAGRSFARPGQRIRVACLFHGHRQQDNCGPARFAFRATSPPLRFHVFTLISTYRSRIAPVTFPLDSARLRRRECASKPRYDWRDFFGAACHSQLEPANEQRRTYLLFGGGTIQPVEYNRFDVHEFRNVEQHVD